MTKKPNLSERQESVWLKYRIYIHELQIICLAIWIAYHPPFCLIILSMTVEYEHVGNCRQIPANLLPRWMCLWGYVFVRSSVHLRVTAIPSRFAWWQCLRLVFRCVGSSAGWAASNAEVPYGFAQPAQTCVCVYVDHVSKCAMAEWHRIGLEHVIVVQMIRRFIAHTENEGSAS
jgi:hypothetical protein